VVSDPKDATGLRVALTGSDAPRLIAPSRLRNHEDWWAMTIHKSQGSEFDHVVVSLPEMASTIVSRELLYTAVTRAKSQVTVVGKPDVVRATAEHRVERASGLRDRLSGGS
jgi:exodeoxyribonuclease V alpha subunit